MSLGSLSSCDSRCLAVWDQRSCSPPNWPISFSAFSSVAWTFSRPVRNVSASRVRAENSSFIALTRSSISAISASQLERRVWHRSSSASACCSSSVSGWIFSSTSEYRMFALTHAARGAAATDTRVMVAASNDEALLLSSLATSLRMERVILLASKLRMSSLTPRERRNFFIDSQLTSLMPRSLSTAPRTSAMASGGILSEVISFRCSDLIPPTAFLAWSRIGCVEASSFLISSCREMV
mmetsp:Transcript_71499/g.201945  ORF Transcript_71499/g.201945 Transcript_71499/m.201945 type:complete len:239 (-) Transcript_71499:3419-4135(-)